MPLVFFKETQVSDIEINKPRTADGVEVDKQTEVFWKYEPDKPYRAIGRFSAIPVEGGSSEPMSEMLSTQALAQAEYDK